jgi:hypothetical protein
VNRWQLGEVDVVIRSDRHAPEDTRGVMSVCTDAAVLGARSHLLSAVPLPRVDGR